MSNGKEDSHFTRLPTEVREMIYQYLLIAKYTAREQNMRSKEFDHNRGYLQYGPDQTYEFHTSILGTNRRIRAESMDLCRRKNDFICLTSRRPSRLGEALRHYGLGMIAKGPKAHGFWNVSMTLTIDSENLENLPHDGPWYYGAPSYASASKHERPWKYVFSSEELPTFCRLMLQLGDSNGRLLHNAILHIEINPAISNGQAKEIDSTPAGLSRTQKLLEPLRQLHSLGAAHVEGPVSSSYKRSMNASLCAYAPTAICLIEASMQDLVQGDKDVNEGRLLHANQMYKSALNHARSCCWQYEEDSIILNDGPFPGFEPSRVLANLEVRLQARIASVYLKNGMMRMARIYTERAMDPRRPYDDRHNKEYTLDIEPWERVVYAEVLHVAAQIRYIQGNVWEAIGHMDDAKEWVPLNEKQKFTYEMWQARAKVLGERRDRKKRAEDLNREKHAKKTEAFFLVACNWKEKGDHLLRRGKSELAASKYMAALGRTYRLENAYVKIHSGTFAGYYGKDGIAALTFRLQASLAVCYLKSECYDDVILITDAALKISHDYRDSTHAYNREFRRKWREDQRLDYQRVHQCRALAHKHMGDMVQAVEHMEKALEFDPGDGNVFAQLGRLKEQLEEEVAEHGSHAILAPPDKDESS